MADILNIPDTDNIQNTVLDILESPEPDTYSQVRDQANKLKSIATSDSNMLSDANYKDIAKKATQLRGAFHKSLKDVDYKTINITHPDRGDVIGSIRESILKSLERFQIESLSQEERSWYIRALVEYYGQIYYKLSSDYHVLSLPLIDEETSPSRNLLEKVAKDKHQRLTPVEESMVFEEESREFKVHLTVPPGKRLLVLRRLLELKQKDGKIVDQIFKEKEARGEQKSATGDEILVRGGKLTSVGRWKMKDFTGFEDPYFADFVFYVGEPKNIEEKIKLMTTQLGEALRDLDLPVPEEYPRYSMPVLKDGKVIPGISVVQGNGDFKSYLKVSGGDEKLGKFYDKNTNYALRVGSKISSASF